MIGAVEGPSPSAGEFFCACANVTVPSSKVPTVRGECRSKTLRGAPTINTDWSTFYHRTDPNAQAKANPYIKGKFHMTLRTNSRCFDVALGAV
jgi:hypothetical protein